MRKPLDTVIAGRAERPAARAAANYGCIVVVIGTIH